MRFNDKDYHAKRAREHRALADAAATEKARMAHITMVDLHSARAGKVPQSVE